VLNSVCFAYQCDMKILLFKHKIVIVTKSSQNVSLLPVDNIHVSVNDESDGCSEASYLCYMKLLADLVLDNRN